MKSVRHKASFDFKSPKVFFSSSLLFGLAEGHIFRDIMIFLDMVQGFTNEMAPFPTWAAKLRGKSCRVPKPNVNFKSYHFPFVKSK